MKIAETQQIRLCAGDTVCIKNDPPDFLAGSMVFLGDVIASIKFFGVVDDNITSVTFHHEYLQ